MPARALENKVYFAVSNRFGTERLGDEEVLFKGNSAIYGFNGEVLALAPADQETVLIAEIAPESTRDKSFNPVNDIFDDRRPDMYFKD
jgi:predicted amidohydrolase